MTFNELGLSEKVLDAVRQAGFETPTPIQEQAIPVALQGRDVLGIAQTGTGKTGAFVLPMLTQLEAGRARARMPRTLIIEPTRELAAQVADAFTTLGKNHKLTMALLIGGVSFDEQDRRLGRGADVLIATPGRLLDHFGRGKLLLTGVEILVIDEADRMLDMGFIPDVERICKLLPPRRQTLFFSATMPSEIQRLVASFLNNPKRVEVARPASAAANVEQRLVRAQAEPKAKRAALRELIRGAAELKNAIIFCNRKRDVAVLHRSLARHGFNAGALHGDMDQHARMATLDAFRKGEIALLVASDVAARGLDIPEVSHVFNFDVPTHAEDYVHRIGRTGRAGRSGSAQTLVTPAEAKYIRAIQHLIGGEIVWAGETLNLTEEEKAGKRGRRKSADKSADKKADSLDSKPSAGKAKQAGKDTPAKEKPPRKSAEKPARDTAEQVPVASNSNSPQGGQTEKQKSRASGDKGKEQVFGESEFVPAFLLRPARVERK